MNLSIGDRAFVGDAEGYPEWADAEVEVLGITFEGAMGDPDLALVLVRNVQTGAETELFAYRLEPIIDLVPGDEDEPEGETYYVVQDAEGLRALPPGARLLDRDGGLLIYDGPSLSPFEVAELAAYGPFILMNPGCLGATDEEPQSGLPSAKAYFEATEATLPETPVARRAALIGLAQGIVESMNYEATPITVLEYARFLAGDLDREE